ncbi:MAG: HIT family protein [Anaerolineales bacterium]
MKNCIFCDILSGSQPCSLVYQDHVCTAFMDIQPVNPGHLLIIPNKHASNLNELEEITGGHIFQVAQRLAAALRKSPVLCEGINLFLADGAVAGQEVFHVHLHVLPRFRSDGFGFKFGPEYFNLPKRSDLDDIARVIRESI